MATAFDGPRRHLYLTPRSYRHGLAGQVRAQRILHLRRPFGDGLPDRQPVRHQNVGETGKAAQQGCLCPRARHRVSVNQRKGLIRQIERRTAVVPQERITTQYQCEIGQLDRIRPGRQQRVALGGNTRSDVFAKRFRERVRISRSKEPHLIGFLQERRLDQSVDHRRHHRTEADCIARLCRR